MDELLILLNKNVSKIIVDYLTDPPTLPYLNELTNKTQNIASDPDWCYDRYYIDIMNLTRRKLMITTRIVKTGIGAHAIFYIHQNW